MRSPKPKQLRIRALFLHHQVLESPQHIQSCPRASHERFLQSGSDVSLKQDRIVRGQVSSSSTSMSGIGILTMLESGMNKKVL